MAAPLAACLISGKERVRIDRRAFVPRLVRAHLENREVEVRPGRIGVAGAPDAAEAGPARDPLGPPEAGGNFLGMGVIIDALADRGGGTDGGYTPAPA